MPRKGTWMVLLVTLAVFSFPARAQTPDGETPAVETVCDPLQSATPGLYGLCVAYCEAHDADLDPDTLEIGDTTVANENILENYNRRKTASDPEMPCLKTACPCFDAADLAEFYDARCTARGDSLTLIGSQACVRPMDLASALVDLKFGGLSCIYTDFDEATCRVVASTSLATTLDEFTACRDLLLAEVARRELTCSTPPR